MVYWRDFDSSLKVILGYHLIAIHFFYERLERLIEFFHIICFILWASKHKCFVFVSRPNKNSQTNFQNFQKKSFRSCGRLTLSVRPVLSSLFYNSSMQQKLSEVRSCTPFSEGQSSQVKLICWKQNCSGFLEHVRAGGFLDKGREENTTCQFKGKA